MGKRFKTEIVVKPKTTKSSTLVNPEELPALRRYQAVTRLMRKGWTEEAAIGFYDRPRGTCNKLVNGKMCGNTCNGRSRICDDCKTAQHTAAARVRRAGGEHFIDKVCRRCAKTFHGHPCRIYCLTCKEETGDIRIRWEEPKRKPRRKPQTKPKPKPRVLPRKDFPPTWERPLAATRIEQPKPAPVVVPKGMKVTVLDPIIPERYRR